MEKKEYREYFDGLRVFACFLVIVTHTFGSILLGVTDFSFTTVFLWIVWKLSIVAVPLFLMMSGANFIYKPGSMKQYIKQNIYTYIFWMAAYFFVFMLLSVYRGWIGEITPSSFFPAVAGRLTGLPDFAYHLWYFPVLIALYFLKPAFEFSKEKYGYIIKLYLCVMTLLMIIQILQSLNVFYISENFYKYVSLFQALTFYFMAGHYFANNDVKRPRVLFIAAISLSALAMCADAVWRAQFEFEYTRELFTFRDTGIGAVLAIAVFLFFKLYYGRLPAGVRRITHRLSKYTLGIFLVHLLVVNLFNEVRHHFASMNIGVYVILASLVTFVLCLAICFVLIHGGTGFGKTFGRW